MKFTSEDLMKAMGLSVGDRVKTNKGISEVIQNGDKYELLVEVDSELMYDSYPLIALLNKDYEILPRPKRVGDLSCREMFAKSGCKGCPVRNICNEYAYELRNTPKFIWQSIKYNKLYNKAFNQLQKDLEVLKEYE